MNFMSEVGKPKMKTIRQIILVALLAVSAALYITGVYVSTTTTAIDKTVATFAWLVAGSVVCAIVAAPGSILSVLLLFGIYTFGAAGSLLHGIKYVEPLKDYVSYSSYSVLFILLSVLALGGFIALRVLVKGCRDKSRREVNCPGKYASWIPPVAGAALLLLFAMLSIGNWIAYQSDPSKALIALKITDYMGSHLIFEVLAALDICFVIFWVQSRKLWCKACIETAAEGAPAEEPKTELLSVAPRMQGTEPKEKKKPLFVMPSFAFGKKKPAGKEPKAELLSVTSRMQETEPQRRKGFAFSFTGKKEKLVVVGTELIKEAPAEKAKAPPVAVAVKKELPAGPVCASCGKEIYSIAYRCPHCSHYQEFGICTSCKHESTISGAPLPAEVKCEKCGDVYHIDVWKGLRPVGPACSKCGGELYFTEHPCPDCGKPQEFRICPKCGIEYSADGYPLPPMVKCGACGKSYGIDVWKGIKQKPEYCPICGFEAKYVTIVCPECGAEARSRVCLNCNDLVTKCVECGAPNLLRDRKCRGCGKPFGTPAAVCQKCGVRIGNPLDFMENK